MGKFNLSGGMRPILCHIRFWPVCVLALLFLIQGSALGQTPPCTFDHSNPSIKSARVNFKALNYKCAEEELNLLMNDTALNLEDKANAHILMAAVFYALLRDNSDMRTRVIDQFKEAFRTYRDWRGELDIKSSEFSDLMSEARQQVDTEVVARPESSTAQPAPVVKQPKAKSGGSGGGAPWLITGATVASGAFFIFSSSKTSTKWNDYVSSGGKTDLYDSYKSANNMKKIAGGVAIGATLVSGYLWYKYFGNRNEGQLTAAADDSKDLAVYVTGKGITLTYRFR